jgi:hypothetical protein
MIVNGEIKLGEDEVYQAIKDYIWKCLDFKGPQNNLIVEIASLNIKSATLYLKNYKQ